MFMYKPLRDRDVPELKINPPSAWNARFNGNTIAQLDILHFASHLNHSPCALVPQHNWALENKVANPPALPVVHVAATDASLLYLHSNIVLVS